jgi:putative ABC transport system permease protein
MTRRKTPPPIRPDVERELDFHLDMRIRELVAKGMTEEQARRRAMEQFGDYRDSERACVAIDEASDRRRSRLAVVREFWRDVAYAIRVLRRSPGFTAVAILTLALGIGANSAIFSVVNGVLLASLPYPDAHRLFSVRTVYPDGTPYSLSAADFMSVRENTIVFDHVESYTTNALTMTGVGEPRELVIGQVSDGLPALMGWRLARGRIFESANFTPGQAGVVVLDHGFWLRAFGGADDVIGRTLTLAGQPAVVIGVLAPGYRLPAAADAYAPLEYDDTFLASTAKGRRGEFLNVIGHAKPNVDAAAIDRDLRRVGTDLSVVFKPTNDGLTFGAIPLTETIVGNVRQPLLVLLGAVGFVLLVACANVANLLLARASSRNDELAVRVALGAGRGRLVRQLVTEAIVLGIVGGILGLGVAYLGTTALVAARPADIPRLDAITVNGQVVIVTLGISLLTGLIFGIAPALQATGRLLKGATRSGRRTGATTSEHRMRSGLVIAEMALAVVLLIGAGLLIRSFAAMTHVSPGFRAEQAMTFRVSLQGNAYQTGVQLRARATEIEDQLRQLPGVTAVGLSTVLPLSGRGSLVGFAVDGAPPPPANINAEIALASVSPGYFTAIGAGLQRGRTFTAQDTAESPRVAMINEAGARQWFNGEDPITRFVQVNGVRIEIVGLAADVLQRDPSRPVQPMLFVPYTQRSARTLRIVVRSAGDPMAQASAIRGALRELDPNLPMLATRPLTELVADSVARPRFYMSLLALFAAVALILAATGIFGVMSYAVAQRSREISIRMALGATTSGILRQTLGRGLTLAVVGAVVGVGAALALGRVIQAQLFAVSVLDPLTIATVVAALIVSAVLATVLPARRASMLDPARVLR